MTEKLRFGIIGAGRIGRLHAENIQHHLHQAEVLAVSDVITEAAESTARRLNVKHHFEDYRFILDDPAIDAVLICSSTDTHADIIVESAGAHKHIFCEKPIDFDLKRIEHVLQVVEDADVKFQVGFNRRFDLNFIRMKQMIFEGKVGDPHILKITSRDPAPPPPDYVKISGGIFLDMTVHDFDMARFLLQSEVEQVYATGGVLIDASFQEAGDIDTAVTTLRFENGAVGVIDNSRQATYGYDQRIEVFGSKGMVQARNVKSDDLVWSRKENIATSNPLHFFLERYREAYIAEVRAFVEAILNNTPPPVSGLDGLQPIVIAHAAKLSFEENRPIRLDEVWNGSNAW